ncbi:MAG: DNA modification methylase [Armatimonadota bacterium]|nr:MAG: DNA modification methylase [Armatimonadota bacterium]
MAQQGQLMITPHIAQNSFSGFVSSSLDDILGKLLEGDLDFAQDAENSTMHNLHAFPAKYPPALPRLFIQHLTQPGEVVLDPMVGSGTTVLEAIRIDRHGIGVDVDPLALLLAQVKAAPPDPTRAFQSGSSVCNRAYLMLQRERPSLRREMRRRFDDRTLDFLDYWFARETQEELVALLLQIETEPDPEIRQFLRLCFSGIIVTKSGGVSLAMDLAHTRPHKVERKTPRPAIEEFAKRLRKNVASIQQTGRSPGQAAILCADARALPLRDNSVHLIITSPPYAANAIDYMRAHKFSLVWFGYPIDRLSSRRKEYVGQEASQYDLPLPLPESAQQVIQRVCEADARKAKVLERYYQDMTRVMREAYRVLLPGRCAVFVVASSRLRGIDTRADLCLSEIAQTVGFRVAGVGTRCIRRDRRMMPASRHLDNSSVIEQRMHQEYVIGLIK